MRYQHDASLAVCCSRSPGAVLPDADGKRGNSDVPVRQFRVCAVCLFSNSPQARSLHLDLPPSLRPSYHDRLAAPSRAGSRPTRPSPASAAIGHPPMALRDAINAAFAGPQPASGTSLPRRPSGIYPLAPLPPPPRHPQEKKKGRKMSEPGRKRALSTGARRACNVKRQTRTCVRAHVGLCPGLSATLLGPAAAARRARDGCLPCVRCPCRARRPAPWPSFSPAARLTPLRVPPSPPGPFRGRASIQGARLTGPARGRPARLVWPSTDSSAGLVTSASARAEHGSAYRQASVGQTLSCPHGFLSRPL